MTIICLSAVLRAGAVVTLPSFFSDNMVLQQQTEAAIWGTAAPGAKVVITPGWTRTKTVVIADPESGRWFTRLATPAAGGPYDIIISDGEKITLKNVLIGEVWFCSGQSNMEMPMKGFSGQPVEGASDFILRAQASRPIRMCTVRKGWARTPGEECQDVWKENTPDVVAGTSATAYFFAEALNASLDVPIGLLIVDWGGSKIEAWLNRETFEKEFPEESLQHLGESGDNVDRANQRPCLIFNAMVNPLVPFTFKGMIWYQGESNRGAQLKYAKFQPAYVAMMRALFRNPEAPFYYVQIAPYKYDNPDGYTSGYFCETQEKNQSVIPHSGMATTLDIGEYATIHPCKKLEVGRRLAYLALQNDYGITAVEATAPTYKSMTVKDGAAVIKFNVGPLGLAPISIELEGFEVAGADRVFHPATGRVSGGNRRDEMIVQSPEVPEPVAVRYCFRNWSVGTVFNCSGIPLGPFRTDDWDDLMK